MTTASFIYKGSKTNEISFPLGGIGAGCIGLAGNGRLIDWEIFNRPNKGSLNGFSHFAVRAEQNGKVMDARILHGDLHGPYAGEMGQPIFNGFGWGPRRENLSGMPHFREHTFKGEWPLAELEFSGEESFPGRVKLHAWSPFIPNNEDDSGLPGAFFEVELSNTSDQPVDYTVVGALSNPFGRLNARNRVEQVNGITQLVVDNTGTASDDLKHGELTLSTDGDTVSWQQYWYRGRWADSLEVYWRDLLAGGTFTDRVYKSGTQECLEKRDTGHLAVHLTLKPGESQRVRYLLTWHVPNCENYWREDNDYQERIRQNGLTNRWKNWYATRWSSARESGQYGITNWPRLVVQTAMFHRALFSSSLPAVALEAISCNLATLKTPTCLRLEDGTFYGWEGVAREIGSCEGSCTHVWNYAQALAFLFPRLERSMRTANYTYNVDEIGGSHFRIQLPLGIKALRQDMRPCADGQFGDVIKTYRDWKLSGDTPWLQELWPTIRQTIEYAWHPDNPDQWDPERTGVLWGRQHHTLDAELFGPNTWLTGYYLAALKAASEMARVCGDDDFGQECLELFHKGKTWVDRNLFNGEYYHQKIDLSDRNEVARFDIGKEVTVCGPATVCETYWSDEHGQVKYQVGTGLEVDMVIAQWHANLYGLGEILAPDQVRSSLAALFKYNFKEHMRDEYNPWRVYALNGESGLQICTWPGGCEKPMIPLPYAQEDQAGYTYAAAVQMIQSGLIEQGLTVIKAVRDRYDGEKRNPWNEIECGSNYARSMATYSLLNTYSGFSFDLSRGYLGFSPLKDKKDFRCLWSVDNAWGEVIYGGTYVEVKIHQGSLSLNELDVVIKPAVISVDGCPVDFQVNQCRIRFKQTQTVQDSVMVGVKTSMLSCCVPCSLLMRKRRK